MPAFCFDPNPDEASEDMSQTGPSPSILLSDDTTSAKDLLIKVDANKAQLRENAAADGSLLVLDLTNNRVGVATASPTVALDVTGSAAVSAAVTVGTTLGVTGATTLSSTVGITGVATMSANPIVTNTAPGMAFTDSTASAKSLTIAVDADKAQIRESAGAAGSLLVLDLAANRVGVATASPTVALDVTGSTAISAALTVGTTLGVTGVATFSANPIITNTAPSIALTDTTGSAKSLTVAVDADKAQLRESAGAAGSLLVLDLANNRVGIGVASPTVPFEVNGIIRGDGQSGAGLRLNLSGSSDFEIIETSSDVIGLGVVGGAHPVSFNISSSLTTLSGGLNVGGGTTVSTIAFGTYTPTITTVTNLDSAIASADAMYMRVGSVVWVAGFVTADATASGGANTNLGISLPIASDFTTGIQCVGSGATSSAGDPAFIAADSTNNRADMFWASQTVDSRLFSFNFMYRIV